MKRISRPMDWCDLDRLAEDIRAQLVYRRARCQHGKTRRESCHECEGGYATDRATYALGVGRVARWNDAPCIAVSDDGEDVAYLPAKLEYRIRRHEPIEQLKTIAAGAGPDYAQERVIQRILSRLHSYRLIEMQSNLDGHYVVTTPGELDSTAWQFADSVGARSVRFMSDGSAVVRYYIGDAVRYRRFVRA